VSALSVWRIAERAAAGRYHIRVNASTAVPENSPRLAHWAKIASAVLLSAYFLCFAWDGLGARWAEDDMMNLYGAWKPGPWQLLLAQFRPWHGDYRPLGGAFYEVLFSLFGLNPLPYRVAILLLLGFNLWLIYRLARLLGCGELGSAVAVILAAYHAGLGSLHYVTDVIYDILCFTFYLGAFLYYASIRRRGRLLGGWESATFFGLFLCALNAKEMALTLPLVLLAYEAFYHWPAEWSWSGARAWLLGPGRIALCAVPLNLLYLYGKKFGPDPLMKMPAYQPVFALDRWVTFQTTCIKDLLFRVAPVGALGLLFTWTLLTWLAWRYDRPVLRFCWAFLIIAPLPIEFLEGRYQASLYIPFAALAVFAATVLVDVADAAARFLASLPILRRLGRGIPLAVLLIAALIPYVRINWRIRNTFVHDAMVSQGPLTWKVIQQFRAFKPKAPPGSSVLILNDPFHGFDELFIASLCLGDRSITVHLQNMDRLPPEEIANAPHVLAHQDGELVQIR
jgi:hypothetical protein